MFSVSVKLTLLVLVLPVVLVFSFFIAGFYFYRTDIDASGFFTAMSSLLSAVVVVLLVWERLRDSLFNKLEYFHDNYLFDLYEAFQSDIIYFHQQEVKRIRPNLERYGKFMNISLYPENSLKQIDEFLITQTEFDSSLQKLNELAEEYGLNPKRPSEQRLLYHFIGIKPLESLKDFDNTLVNACEKRIQLILKEQSQLVEEIKGLLEKTEKMRKRIYEKLEDFLKSNNLRLEPEQTYFPSPY